MPKSDGVGDMTWMDEMTNYPLLRKVIHYLKDQINEVIGLDIGSGYIKVVQITWQNEQPVLTHYSILEVAEGVFEEGYVVNQAAFTETVKRAIEQSGATAKHVVFGINARNLFSREISFPLMSQEELAEAIKWDIEKYVPYAVNTYYYDSAITEKNAAQGEMKVLLAASPQEIIDTFNQAIRAAGLKPLAADTESLAIYRTMADAKNSAILDVGSVLSQLTVYQNGCPVFSRALPLGGEQVTQTIVQALGLEFHEAERLKRKQTMLQALGSEGGSEMHNKMEFLVRDMARDVRRTMEFYQMQNKGAQLNELNICGGGILLTHLKDYLAQLLEMTVKIHNPLACVQLDASFDKAALAQCAPQMTVALGLALRGGEG